MIFDWIDSLLLYSFFLPSFEQGRLCCPLFFLICFLFCKKKRAVAAVLEGRSHEGIKRERREQREEESREKKRSRREERSEKMKKSLFSFSLFSYSSSLS
jgi:hypothetical protein